MTKQNRLGWFFLFRRFMKLHFTTASFVIAFYERIKRNLGLKF